MRTLLVDNYDSYTYNLFQLVAQVYATPPVVVRNDDPLPDLAGFDVGVISPGPGHPAVARDVGQSARLLADSRLPVLGVCLGHQLVGLAAGARIAPAPRPRHGHLSRIRHAGDGLFAGLPPDFTAVRYHSLCVAEPLPADLVVTARAEDGVVMGLAHRTLPRWGVQFHPESFCTEHGAALIANFGRLALGRRPIRAHPRPPTPPRPAPAGAPLLACVRRLDDLEIDGGSAFTTLYGDSDAAFWLDGGQVDPAVSRFSFLGAAGEVLSYRVGAGAVTVTPTGTPPYAEPGTIFDALRRRTGRPVAGSEVLPFDLAGGYVGYFGYELKADCGAPPGPPAATPDAVWLRADRFVATDHLAGRTYVVAVAEPGATGPAEAWVTATAAALRAPVPGGETPVEPADLPDLAGWADRSRATYLADIAACTAALHAGETYEICLTDTFRVPAPADDLAWYRRLRQLNPAPYAAYLRLGGVTVLCSSPERFLRVGADRQVESRPIKGTAPRAADPAEDERLRLALAADDKARAENLMIVDLVRNDLGRVCEVGSVTVPAFMATESYATVHQLVSTVRGRLRTDRDALDCVQACFPGGSMTGAPKLRTMEILSSLEGSPRGVYAGSLGYLGFTGTADLNIVIRTAVSHGGALTVGAGGAIVLASDPAAEYAEMLVKAAAALRAQPVAVR